MTSRDGKAPVGQAGAQSMQIRLGDGCTLQVYRTGVHDSTPPERQPFASGGSPWQMKG